MFSVQVLFTSLNLRVEMEKEGRSTLNSIFVFSLRQKAMFGIDFEFSNSAFLQKMILPSTTTTH